MEVPKRDSIMQNLDWLSEQEKREVEKIAREENRDVEEVITEMIKQGLDRLRKQPRFFRGPKRGH
jgi:hypothetical protein